jgi:hypothetical protein
MRPYYGRMEEEVVHDERDDDFELDWLDEPLPTYVVKTFAYCGMEIPHDEFETYEEALEYVNRRIDMLYEMHGAQTHKLEDNRWEVGEPENCNMVPDFCGTLVIKEVFK